MQIVDTLDKHYRVIELGSFYLLVYLKDNHERYLRSLPCTTSI